MSTIIYFDLAYFGDPYFKDEYFGLLTPRIISVETNFIVYVTLTGVEETIVNLGGSRVIELTLRGISTAGYK